MEFANKEIELINKSEESVKVSGGMQKVDVTQLQFRTGHNYDE